VDRAERAREALALARVQRLGAPMGADAADAADAAAALREANEPPAPSGLAPALAPPAFAPEHAGLAAGPA